MGWRVVHISSPCTLKVKNRQLCHIPQEGEAVTVPLEDISVLILAHRQITFSAPLLNDLAEYGICLFSCNESHLPNGAFFPFHRHFRYAAVAGEQVKMRLPLRKRLWQETVKAKIRNQALCLGIFHAEEAEYLFSLIQKVQSGDSRNTESAAANYYFKKLFGTFSRQDGDDVRNAYLNYLYAVFRACMARSLVGAGLMPFWGIHHCNGYNAYNLADDMMEAFRPYADRAVKTMNPTQALDSKAKQRLLAVLTETCLTKGEEIGLLPAFDSVASSLAKAILQNNPALLVLPEFKV